jgi:hypothetical protein
MGHFSSEDPKELPSFLIVRVIAEENESQLLPKVKAMLASFQVTDKN